MQRSLPLWGSSYLDLRRPDGETLERLNGMPEKVKLRPVDAVTRAVGFRAVSAPPGRDRGVDIVAHPDPFGFERPRIKVQVKHKRNAAGGPEIRAFLGTLHPGDNGLFVSTGGFTSDAILEAERSREPVKLLDLDGFIQLLIEHYETLNPEYKAKVPLRKVWVPTE